MSLSLDPTPRELNDCGCCSGVGVRSPVLVENRPGLSQIAYRIGTHASFKQTMLARLASPELWRRLHPTEDDAERSPWPLESLHTREDADFSIALLDAWAALADVLTFYQERIASESYLRTATERFSLLQLARLIGYELRPGVAASTDLAFFVEDAEGAPKRATIPAGLKVQSIPGQDELPQTFETGLAFEARAEWNVLRPRLTTPRQPDDGDLTLFLAGIATSLRPGDTLLFVGSEKITSATSNRWDARRLLSVEPYPSLAMTRVAWRDPLGAKPTTRRMPNTPQTHAFRQRAAIFGHNAQDWRSLPDAAKRSYLGLAEDAALSNAQKREWPDFAVRVPDESETDKGTADQSGDPLEVLVDPLQRLSTKRRSDTIDLDNVYAQVTPGSWALLSTPSEEELFQVTGVTEVSRAELLLTAKVTRLTLRGNLKWLEKVDGLVREISVLVQSEQLGLAERPIEDPATTQRVPVSDSTISLDRAVPGLVEGHALIVVGRDAGSGEAASEKVQLLRTEADGAVTRLMLTAGLSRSYERASLHIYGNVVPATHGETVREVLGGGDGREAFQRFRLRQAPLAHVAAAVESGAESTLELRVNQVLWRDVPSLNGRGPDERVYVARREDDGSTTVQFGDGKTGARPPSGQENVTAVYRKGIGLAGQVRAGQLSLLAQRPLGVREVQNPQAASGAADPESRDDARRNAPLTVLALGRIVSLQDYEDFAGAFAGIGKALATWTWDGERRAVFVTVAGPGGVAVPEDSALHGRLLTAMREGSDPFVPLRVETYSEATFRIGGTVHVSPEYLPERVLAAVEQTLRERFSFEARRFGQPVELSEVVAAIQAVDGVVAVVVDELYRLDPNLVDQTPGLNQRLTAALPQAGSRTTVLAAELLTLDPGPLGLEAAT